MLGLYHKPYGGIKNRNKMKQLDLKLNIKTMSLRTLFGSSRTDMSGEKYPTEGRATENVLSPNLLSCPPYGVGAAVGGGGGRSWR